MLLNLRDVDLTLHQLRVGDLSRLSPQPRRPLDRLRLCVESVPGGGGGSLLATMLRLIGSADCIDLTPPSDGDEWRAYLPTALALSWRQLTCRLPRAAHRPEIDAWIAAHPDGATVFIPSV